MLIHFPSALFPMDFACALICFFTGNAAFGAASLFAGVGGVIMGWLALLAGITDLMLVYETKNHLIKKVLLHAGINSIVLIGFTVITYQQYKLYPTVSSPTVFLLILKAVMIGIMIIGNFIGGSLILKDKVAVEK
jgi:uncharacterized membrane protein